MYNDVNELPDSVRNALSSEDAQVWMDAYNSCWMEGNVSEVPPEYTTPEQYWKRQAWMACRHLPSSRFVEPVVTTAVVDKEGDLVNIDEYLSEGFKYIDRGGVGSGLHSSKIVFVVWDMYKTVDEGTGAEAIAVRLNFFRGAPIYDRAWVDFLKGRRQWSIRSTTHDETECENGLCYNVLHPTQWVELSNVDIGINPRTYVIQLNEHAKGAMIMNDYNDEVMCPVLEHYLDYKEKINLMDGLSCNIVDGGVVLVHGSDVTRADELTNEYYSDCTTYKGSCEGGEDYTLIIPHSIDSQSDFLHDMVHLIMDEQEAIEGYHTIMQSVIEGPYPEKDKIDLVSDTFKEIVADEGNHIGKLMMLIKEIDPEYYASIEEGFNGTEDGEKEAVKSACPVGQHQHPGVRGCHDIFRQHHEDNRGNSSDKLDLTDEDIDVPSIETMETSELQKRVINIARILTHHSQKDVEEFLGSTGGKEFVLMFLELKKRTGSHDKGEDNMETKAEIAEPKPEEVSEEEKAKGMETQDVPSMLSTALTALSGLVAQVDGMNSRLLKLEQVVTSNAGDSQMDISQEILSEASGEPAEEPTVDETIAGNGGGAGANNIESAEPDGEESEDEDEEEEEDEDKKPAFLKNEEEGESEDDDDSEDEEKDSKDEEEGDKSDDESEDSEDSDKKEEEKEPEDKKDKKPEGEDKDKDKDKEKKKGNEEPATSEIISDAPADAPVASEDLSAVADEVPAEAPVTEPVVEATSEQTDSAVEETPDTAVETPAVADEVPAEAPVEEASVTEPIAPAEEVKGEVDYVELALRDLGIIGSKPVTSLADVEPVQEINRMKGDTVVVMPRNEAIAGTTLPVDETIEGIKGNQDDTYMDAGTGIDNKTFYKKLMEELR